MRTLRIIMAAVVAIVGFVVVPSPASASAPYVLTRPDTGDTAYWYRDENILMVCDHSPGNGTAYTILNVINGGGWILYDNNGAQPGCGVAGPLSVDNTKHAILEIWPGGHTGGQYVAFEVPL